MYRLRTIPAPIDPDSYTVDVDALAELSRDIRPKLITIGGSLNLIPHPVPAIREIANSDDAKVLFDAAHLCGLIAGGAWPNPLDQGAHLMSMSTYKSLGGPPGGLLLANDAELAQRIEAIAYPGLTANFDAGKTAALAQTMLDWTVAGPAYATAMIDTARALADGLVAADLPVFRRTEGVTGSHQFALEAAGFGGGQAAAARLRRANLLTCGIGLPIAAVSRRRQRPTTGHARGRPAGHDGRRHGRSRHVPRPRRPDRSRPRTSPTMSPTWRTQFDQIYFTTDHPTVSPHAA